MQPSATPRRRRPRVLLVEDRTDIFVLYTELLEASGHEVIGAIDGEAAVTRARELLPDVILMDLGLPKLDGVSATRLLKRDPRTAHIPILMLSGYVQPQVIARAHEAGCDAFLAKPLPIDRLLSEVRLRVPAPATERALVLVIEDDDDVRASIVDVLVTEGYGAIEARHGREAIERLAAGALPRLILLDLMMPVMDGWHFRDAQRANPAWAGIPTLVLSAVPRTRQDAARLGAVGYLGKPVELPALLGAIERHAV